MDEKPAWERIGVACAAVAVITTICTATVAQCVAATLGDFRRVPPVVVAGFAFVLAALALPRVARALPAALDGSFRRRRVRTILWGLSALVAVLMTARTSAFMVYPEPSLSAVPDDFIVHHSCFSAYANAVELIREGRPNVWDASLTPADPHIPGDVPPPVLRLGPFNLDAFEYPPPFLLLPKALMTVSRSFMLLRTVWFALEALSFLWVLLSLARWLGGRTGMFAALLIPALWISVPTMLTFQIGNFHMLAVALAIAGMLAFDRKRDELGGALLGFAVISKLFPGLLLVYLATARRWRAVGWTVAWAVAYAALGLVVFGVEPYRLFFTYQLPRIASGEAFAFAFIEKNTFEIAANLSVYGLVYKLKVLGLGGMSRALAAGLSWVYTTALVAFAVVAGRRQGATDATASRATQAATWLALLNLGALRSPFAPLYVVVPVLWLLTLLAAEIRGRTRWTVLTVVTWLVVSVLPPLPNVVVVVILSMIAQALVLGVNGWVALRRPATAATPA